MTDIETIDNAGGEEKALNGYAQLRNKMKSKYEWQINDLQAQIESLQQQIYDWQKSSVKSALTNAGFDWDFDSFYDKYAERGFEADEMVALYKGMNWVSANTQPLQEVSPQPVLWAKSVIGRNPTETSTVNPDNMSPTEYRDYLKANIDRLG